MRLHITLDDDLAEAVDALAGERGRSRFIRDAVAAEVERRRKLASFWSAVGSIPDFAPGVDAEAIHEERRRSTEHQDRRLAPHWGHDPARLDRPD